MSKSAWGPPFFSVRLLEYLPYANAKQHSLIYYLRDFELNGFLLQKFELKDFLFLDSVKQRKS